MPIYASDVTVSVSNDGVDFYLGKSDYIKNVLFMFQFGSNQVCKIGQNCTFEQAKIFSCSNGGGLIIGDDCMFSTDIYIWCSDGHVVVNEDTGDVLNNVKGPITIGNHCWICQGARITKNAVIHDNSIVGNSAVVYKDYIENNVIISGNPGQIVKHGITWKREHN